MYRVLYEMNNNTHIESYPKGDGGVSSSLGGQIKLFVEE